MPEYSAELLLFVSRLPTDPGVYRMMDDKAKVLYVGKASNLKKRVSSYFNKQNTSLKTQSLVSQICSIDISVTRSEMEALLLESNLIKALKPKYNILLRDDKSYPYIHFSSHKDYPRIEHYRSKKKPVAGNFFGPYPSGLAVKDTLITIQKIFKLRNCSDSYFNARTRPCLQYQIKRCTAPCVDFISPEHYQQSVADAIGFLEGKCQQILDELVSRMAKAVDALSFEEAALLRDQIKSLRLVQEQQAIVQLQGDADVIAIEASPGFACIQWVSIREGQVLASQSLFPTLPEQISMEDSEPLDLWQQVFRAFINFYYLDEVGRIPALIITQQAIIDHKALEALLSQQRGKSCVIQTNPRGPKKRWVDFALNNARQAVIEFGNNSRVQKERYQELERILALSQPIQRMECFDISHTQGTSTVASCVVFTREGPCTNEYRRYSIEGITPGDDYAAMEQAVRRRFRYLLEIQSLPDVLIIDGGKGQVSMAQRVLTSLQVEGVVLLGIAKGPGRKAGLEKLILVNEGRECNLPEDSKALHLLQHIRDEAHRFAITSHRKKRHKSGLTSSLESIEGIGVKRRKALLQRFGGLTDLSKASQEEIEKVPGISVALAARIYEYFR